MFRKGLYLLVLMLPVFAAEDGRTDLRVEMARRVAGITMTRMAPRAVVVSGSDVVRSGSSLRAILAVNQTVAPGDYLYVDFVPINFGGAEMVAVAMTDTQNVAGGIGMLWSTADEAPVLTDAIPFDVITAARVPVYGPSLRMLIVNTGKSTMRISQLIVYTCVH